MRTPGTAPGSISRRPAPARRSSSSTSSPATTAAGSRRCASSRAISAASPTPPAASRPPTSRRTPSATRRRIARGDALAVLDHLKIDRAHIVGLSMGGFAALHVGITYPQRARSLVIARLRLRRRARQEGEVPRRVRGGRRIVRQQLVEAATKYALGPDARAVPEQGPARLGGVRAAARRPLAEGPGAHHARRADAAARRSTS